MTGPEISASAPKPIRSPAYPNAPLHEAIAQVRKIEALYRNSPVDRVVGAKLIGYSGLSGPANQAMSTLAQYGLVERAGKGEMRVTPRAQALLHPNNEGERLEQLRLAAFEPPLFRELHERFPGMIPPAEGVMTYLNRQGFNKIAVRPATKAYLDTLLYLKEVGVSESHGTETPEGAVQVSPPEAEPQISRGGARVGDIVDYEVGGVVANAAPLRVRAISPDQAWVFVDGSLTGLEMENIIVRDRATAPEVIERPSLPFNQPEALTTPETIEDGYRSETFDADEGTIKISWPSNLSAQSVEDMKDWLELLKRRIARRATSSGE